MRPNIISIVSDDQGAWALGCSGNEEIETPNLDELSSRGVRFENMFCVSPVCSPARASLLTGKIPSQHGIQDWIREGNSTIEGDCGNGRLLRYLAGQTAYTALLRSGGYSCGMVGKWHLGDAHHRQMGFDYWYAHAKGGGPYYGAPMIENETLTTESRYVTDAITDRALDFLSGTDRDQPFCLNVNYTAPHSPWDRANHPAADYEYYYERCSFDSIRREQPHPEQINSAPVPVDEESRRQTLSGYFAAITAMDRNIGRLLDWIDSKGIREETLVFFTSDNGMNMGHHGIYGKGNGTFPQNMYDTSVKVPGIISWPGTIPMGEVSKELVSHYDYFPTVLDFAGVSLPENFNGPGISLRPLLTEDGGGHTQVVVCNEYGPVRMIRNHKWKYVHRYPYGPHELYDLEADPEERRNLVGEADTPMQQEMRRRLEAWFFSYVDPGRDAIREAVTGKGQTGLSGEAKEGREPFAQDFAYLFDKR